MIEDSEEEEEQVQVIETEDTAKDVVDEPMVEQEVVAETVKVVESKASEDLPQEEQAQVEETEDTTQDVVDEPMVEQEVVVEKVEVVEDVVDEPIVEQEEVVVETVEVAVESKEEPPVEKESLDKLDFKKPDTERRQTLSFPQQTIPKPGQLSPDFMPKQPQYQGKIELTPIQQYF